MMPAEGTRLGAILLAGGRGSRMGDVAKPLLRVGDRSLLEEAVDAATRANADPIAVVSAMSASAIDVTWVRESVPHGGPAAGIIAALDSWSSGDDPTWTLVLACDLPRVVSAVDALLSGASFDDATDGSHLCTSDGRAHWLTALYRTASLRRAAETLPDSGRGASVRALVGSLRLGAVHVPDALVDDIDTWEDLREARRAGSTTIDDGVKEPR